MSNPVTQDNKKPVHNHPEFVEGDEIMGSFDYSFCPACFPAPDQTPDKTAKKRHGHAYERLDPGMMWGIPSFGKHLSVIGEPGQPCYFCGELYRPPAAGEQPIPKEATEFEQELGKLVELYRGMDYCGEPKCVSHLEGQEFVARVVGLHEALPTVGDSNGKEVDAQSTPDNKHTHTPWPEYKRTLTTSGLNLEFVNDIMAGLQYSSISENCPACQFHEALPSVGDSEEKEVDAIPPDNKSKLDKQIREKLSFVLMDGQNQIHDLRDGGATPEQITERMFASLDYHTTKIETLINAAVAEAVIDGIEMCAHELFVTAESVNGVVELDSGEIHIRINNLITEQRERLNLTDGGGDE